MYQSNENVHWNSNCILEFKTFMYNDIYDIKVNVARRKNNNFYYCHQTNIAMLILLQHIEIKIAELIQYY